MSQPVDAGGSASKVLNDPIHGHIYLSPLLKSIVDTPEFQRLRDLKQLGAAYLVFPGASHNRFEHCVGVAHLAGKMMERFQRHQPELGITDREIDIVRVAGLCHDLGHGPFSHAFEHIIETLRPERPWHHEEMSEKMFDYMVEENAIDVTPAEAQLVKALIRGKPTGAPNEKRFMFDIVANHRNGVDVDKFDYLARDCHNLGMKSTYDSDRLFSFTKVIDGEICFYAKEAYNVYEMFHTRYSLHKQVYSHRVGKAVELMIQDALRAANNFLKITDCVDDPARFCSLTDCILRNIEFSTDESTRGDQGMAIARGIIRDLRKRNLYKCVEEIILSADETERYDNQEVTEDDIVKFKGSHGYDLQPEDLHVVRQKLNYSRGKHNPVDSIHFFTHWQDNDKIVIPAHKVSHLIPVQFQEEALRIFVTNPTQEVITAAKGAFRAWCRINRTATPTPLSRANSSASFAVNRPVAVSAAAQAEPGSPQDMFASAADDSVMLEDKDDGDVTKEPTSKRQRLG